MRSYLAGAFPFLLAFLLPLAGLVIALNHLQQGDRELARSVGIATAAGAVAWALLLTA